MQISDDRLKTVLRSWRESLIDLSGKNRLLNFRHTQSATLEIVSPDATRLLAGIAKGLRFAEIDDVAEGEDEGAAEATPSVAAREGEIVTQKATQKTLESALRKLFRDSNQIFADTGLWVLQLGVGFLDWSEERGSTTFSAPLLLVPVVLERRIDGFRLLAAEEEDATPNPALAVKMEQLGIEWPTPEQMEDLSSALASVRRAVSGQNSWKVSDRAVLATFQSHKEAMYRDLLDNEARLLENPLVHAIGLGPQASIGLTELDFDPVRLEELDDVQAPEDTPLVLDADSSQRQCLAAALQGRTFVMDGPPGTGKSQTIANMIAGLLHAGRTVLFVSEKAAALDVVRNRLEHIGLGSFLMPLHSHNTSRKHVAQELGRALTERPRARTVTPARERVRRLRGELSGYAEAMNEIRIPLDRSLFDVVGRLAELEDEASLAPDARYRAGDLSAQRLHDILAAADAVSRAWRPALEGDSFLWAGLEKNESPRPYLERVTEELELLHRALQRHEELTAALGLGDLPSVETLIKLLDLTATRPAVPSDWVSVDDLTPLLGALSDFETRRSRLIAVEESVEEEVGPAWRELPHSLSTITPDADATLAALSVPGIDVASLTAGQARTIAESFTGTAAMLRSHHASLADVAGLYGVAEPNDFDAAADLCEIVEFSTKDPKPEADWLESQSLQAARFAAGELETALTRLDQARTKASDLFSEKVRTFADLRDLARRFAEEHHGMAKLSGAYRRDKKALAELTVDGRWRKAAAARLPEAVAWREADERFQAVEREHAEKLGGYWAGEKTDFEAVRRALQSAERISKLAGAARSRKLLADQVAVGGTPNATAYEAVVSVREDLAAWRNGLVPAPRSGGRPALARTTFTEAAEWYEAHLPVLRAAAELVQTVDAVSRNAPLTVATARGVITAVGEARRERAAFDVHRVSDEALLGGLYREEHTDRQEIDAAVGWVRGVHEVLGVRVPPHAAELLLEAEPDPDLAVRHKLWREATEGLVRLWGEADRHELRATLTGSFAEAEELIARMRADNGGPEEWRAFKHAHEALQEHSLSDLIDRAVSRGVPAERFGRVVERSVLQAWVEHHLADDSRLATVRAVQRDALVEEFRRLDKELIDSAYAQVIDACNARRPNSTIGPAAVIRREAEKKTRHMPVRTLLSQAAETVHRIKPCFMMSPLTVSQFLPPDFRFDVVISDEASQVLPHDAINCIYRGRSLIVAGDQKQMPPTNFFGSSESENGEYDEETPDSFESLLDLCKASGVIRSLPLRWHYRSRHEDLIAFSNREFYESELVTFPGVFERGPDIGVAFEKVPGVYGRGRSRNNPIEARRVAERVMEHFTHRPDRSLGVVALSEAQARCIDEAIEEARRTRPDLDRFFGEDRLDGFFVKNLETVQGDERDVIIISIGYGRDEHGKLSMNFGPLNKKDGWRRLNVAVTRARYKVEVISSIIGGDISDSDNVSRQHLKRYLEYAEQGPAILAQHLVAREGRPESAFEESVAAVIQGWGYEVVPQVGVAGYRIDLGVRHPEQPGRYAVGIECDGPMYHSSPVTRDRDRLRDQVLRGLGWELHRVWGADWYRNRTEAEQRLRAAIETAVEKRRTAVAEPAPQPEAGVPEEETVPVAAESGSPRVRMETVDDEVDRSWSAPYRTARVRLITGLLPDMHLPEAQSQIRSLFSQILEVESPIHRDQLFQRARDAWGVRRLGERIQNNLDEVLRKMKSRREVEVDGLFVSLAGAEVIARSPGDGIERKIAHIAPSEREAALLSIIRESPGICESDLITEVSRFFGWRRSGAEITSTLTRDIRRLGKRGRISTDPGRIVLTDE
ncbi:DUF4011 domain-containing protein [Planomonospora alba]|uniref:DUF4011 domain-containing protein n=1 Tax=Planomonospora alba TaxID=161354 RepID=A0ABP6MLS7_9ACTN